VIKIGSPEGGKINRVNIQVLVALGNYWVE
jgi:hypothetical protein